MANEQQQQQSRQLKDQLILSGEDQLSLNEILKKKSTRLEQGLSAVSKLKADLDLYRSSSDQIPSTRLQSEFAKRFNPTLAQSLKERLLAIRKIGTATERIPHTIKSIEKSRSIISDLLETQAEYAEVQRLFEGGHIAQPLYLQAQECYSQNIQALITRYPYIAKQGITKSERVEKKMPEQVKRVIDLLTPSTKSRMIGFDTLGYALIPNYDPKKREHYDILKDLIRQASSIVGQTQTTRIICVLDDTKRRGRALIKGNYYIEPPRPLSDSTTERIMEDEITSEKKEQIEDPLAIGFGNTSYLDNPAAAEVIDDDPLNLLPKPSSHRIKVVVPQTPPPRVKLTIDAQMIKYQDQQIELTGNELKLFQELVNRMGEPITIDELSQLAFNQPPHQSAIDVYLKSLEQKLQSLIQNSLIQTEDENKTSTYLLKSCDVKWIQAKASDTSTMQSSLRFDTYTTTRAIVKEKATLKSERFEAIDYLLQTSDAQFSIDTFLKFFGKTKDNQKYNWGQAYIATKKLIQRIVKESSQKKQSLPQEATDSLNKIYQFMKHSPDQIKDLEDFFDWMYERLKKSYTSSTSTQETDITAPSIFKVDIENSSHFHHEESYPDIPPEEALVLNALFMCLPEDLLNQYGLAKLSNQWESRFYHEVIDPQILKDNDFPVKEMLNAKFNQVKHSILEKINNILLANDLEKVIDTYPELIADLVLHIASSEQPFSLIERLDTMDAGFKIINQHNSQRLIIQYLKDLETGVSYTTNRKGTRYENQQEDTFSNRTVEIHDRRIHNKFDDYFDQIENRPNGVVITDKKIKAPTFTKAFPRIKARFIDEMITSGYVSVETELGTSHYLFDKVDMAIFIYLRENREKVQRNQANRYFCSELLEIAMEVFAAKNALKDSVLPNKLPLF